MELFIEVHVSLTTIPGVLIIRFDCSTKNTLYIVISKLYMISNSTYSIN